MESQSISRSLLFIFLVALFCSQSADSHGGYDGFLRCLQSRNNSAILSDVYTPQNSSYLSILQSSIKNLRFTSPSTPRPLFVVTPVDESQIQALVLCSKESGIQIRTRSGGHDYEGLSYASQVPFVIIDLINLSEITIDAEQQSAWVQSGATIGQLYYEISKKSRTLAFPAGACPTVGLGGYLSGGGYGSMLRKFGLAADNVVDARLIDANGRILDRKSMGEDLFWAIRGGGGASFGVITAWKLNLVTVPETLTLFAITRTLEQNATKLIHRWQYVAPSLPEDITLAVGIRRANNSSEIQVIFVSLFLGPRDRLLELLGQSFPELGVRGEDCTEVSWIQSTLILGGLLSGYPVGATPEALANRNPPIRRYFKAKSDYVQEPIPEHAFEGMWRLIYEQEATTTQMFVPYGGRMKEISESALPFPHREGNLYKIQYYVAWDEPGVEASSRCVNWIRRLYSYMTPYVSKFPRAAYINYRDLDLGVNNEGNTSYAQASVWGFKYFKSNFNRLVQIKTTVDPSNFFRNEQSIPPLYY